MTKRSRLAEEKSPVRLSKQDGRFYHLKPGLKKCLKNDHLNTGQSSIQWFTVVCLHPYFNLTPIFFYWLDPQ
jgi:hypothetical protein